MPIYSSTKASRSLGPLWFLAFSIGWSWLFLFVRLRLAVLASHRIFAKDWLTDSFSPYSSYDLSASFLPFPWRRPLLLLVSSYVHSVLLLCVRFLRIPAYLHFLPAVYFSSNFPITIIHYLNCRYPHFTTICFIIRVIEYSIPCFFWIRGIIWCL